MNKIEALPNIDFADSIFKQYEYINGELYIYITSWDCKKIKLVFKDCIRLLFRGENFISNVYELTNSEEILESFWLERFKKSTEKLSYKLFHIEDIDDFPFIEIMAKELLVIKES